MMEITRPQIAEYIHDITTQLEIQARIAGFETTAYLLRLIVEDMAQAKDAPEAVFSRDSVAS